MEGTDRCTWHGTWPCYLVPIARLRTADTGSNFLGTGRPVNSYSNHEQGLNTIRNKFEAYKTAITDQGHPESHLHGDIVGPS